jgi:hypothetical protein
MDASEPTREELIALVAELKELLRVQAQTLEEIVDERDAARLLNELCHY